MSVSYIIFYEHAGHISGEQLLQKDNLMDIVSSSL